MSEKTTLRIKRISERMTIGQPPKRTKVYAKKMRRTYRKLNHKQKGEFLKGMEKKPE